MPFWHTENFVRENNIMKKYKVGLQLYTIKPHVVEDMDKALKEVAEMGYDDVEFAGYFDHSAEELKGMLDKYGLECISTHQHINIFEEQGQKAVDFQKKLGIKYSVIPGCGVENIDTPEKWNKTRGNFLNTSKLLKENGIQLFYHNHCYEFEKYGDKLHYYRIFDEVGLDNIKPEIDVCWAYYGGMDVCELIRRYKGHVPIMHIKDFACRNIPADYDYAEGKHKVNSDDDNGFYERPVGMGVLKLKDIIETAKECGTEYFIVEMDACLEFSRMESAKMSLDNLRKLL